MYLPIRRSLPAPPEPDDTFLTASTSLTEDFRSAHNRGGSHACAYVVGIKDGRFCECYKIAR